MVKQFLPQINLQRCNQCNICINECPEDALTIADQGPEFSQPVTCTYCAVCESVCPTGAIRLPMTITWANQ
jgi:NAD-dependent dihydropyrimidine dehydrogenase PreA subunit